MSDGPVRIMIDYCVDPDDYNDFVHAIHNCAMCVCATARCAGGSFRTPTIRATSTRPS
jgi:hypothetical protein